MYREKSHESYAAVAVEDSYLLASSSAICRCLR